MRPLEHAAAPEREQRVAAEQGLALCEPVRDMTRRMPWHVPHLGFCVEQLVGIAVGDLDIDHRDAVAVRLRTDNDAAGLFFNLGYAADMIIVMMGGQYMSQFPAEHVECLKHGRGIRGVYHGRVAG